ncbi:MAG: hypothetical protein SGJ18_05145 [Pseudomonadota bacterium]|nr:hypothetical protein [Pseudomonadota bacterium]
MTKNQSGGLLMSLMLFMMTLTIIVTMVTNFFKLNRQVQAIAQQAQTKSVLRADLTRLAKIEATLRLSSRNASNAQLLKCMLSPSGCTTSQPQEFILASPVKGQPPIAGTTSNPVAYSSTGERCTKPKFGCENLAISFFAVNSGFVQIWLVTQTSSDKIKLRPNPDVAVSVNNILNLKTGDIASY